MRKVAVTMRIVPYHKHYNRNTGRIKAIDDDQLVINVNAGRGGGEMRLPVESCRGFQPKVDDRILLCVDDDGEIPGFILQKLKKTRQEAPVTNGAPTH